MQFSTKNTINILKSCIILILLTCMMSLPAFESRAKWIWRPGDKAEYGEKLLLRKEINLASAPSEGFFNVLGDDHFTLFLNGEQLFHQSGFTVHKIDARKLKAGKNVISAIIKNDKDIAGLLIYGEFKINNEKMTFITDTSWKVHAPTIINQQDWKLPGYDDSKWQNAIVMSGVTTQNVWKQFVKPEYFLSADELAVIKAEDLRRKNVMRNAMLEAEKRLAKEPKVGNAEFVRRNNIPFISINDGKKLLVAPFFNTASYTSKLNHDTFDKFKRYGKNGFEVVTSSADMKIMWKDENTVDISSAENSLKYLHASFPDSYVIVMIDIEAPQWFLKKYPQELIRYGATDKLVEGDEAAQPVPRMSMASDIWITKGCAALDKIIRKLEASPVGKRIIGYQINYGVYSEWHYYGMEKQMPDTSAPMQAAFSRYLKNKYGSDQSLQKAWKDKSVTLATAKIPSNDIRKIQTQDKTLASDADRRCPDFYDCMALAVNNCQAKFNKTVKKACKRKVIVGNYSGYFFSMPYPTVAFQTRTPEMLDSDAVDYQVSPFSYFLWHRCSGGSGLIRSPFETYALHNKVAVLEADNRTHQATTRSGNTCKTAEDSLGQMAREFCNALTKGSTLWYYDFNIFWYDYPEYYEFFPKLLKIWQEENDAARVSEVAGVCDYDSIAYHNSAVNPNRFTDKITGDVCHEMFYAGAPFDSILIEDIGRKNTPEYKVYVFFNLVHLTDEKVTKVEKLLDNGALCIFICAPELEQKFKGRKNAVFTKNKVPHRTVFKSYFKSRKVHIYSEDKDSVLFASKGLVGLHHNKPGRATIKLPRKAVSVEQLLPVRRTLPASDIINYNNGKSETSLFRIKY